MFQEYLKIYDTLKALSREISSKKTVQQYIKDVNDDIKANTHQVEYSLVIDNAFKSGSYAFTAFKSSSIRDETDLKEFCNKSAREEQRSKNTRKNNYDITKAMRKLNFD